MDNFLEPLICYDVKMWFDSSGGDSFLSNFLIKKSIFMYVRFNYQQSYNYSY